MNHLLRYRNVLRLSSNRLQGHQLPSLMEEAIMRIAIKEAAKGIGHTSPNPAVGAVIVRGGKIVARGFHRAAGMPHAEIEALRKVSSAKGATLFVTLEPCSTHGRTPPCTEAIIRSGVRRVVIGTLDPNPAHAGRGLEILRAAGITVKAGVLETECRELNPGFNKWIVTGMPLVIAKAALSLDGRLSRPPGESRWLTGPGAIKDAHRLRARVDAILIGAETLRTDNPRLTVRDVRGARQPLRVVITRSGNLPKSAHLFTDEFRDRTLVYQGKSLRVVLRDLGKRGVTSVMIEGGGGVLGQAFDQRLVDRVQFYLAPLIVGGPKLCVNGLGAPSSAAAPVIRNPVYKKLGPDLRLTGEVEYASAG